MKRLIAAAMHPKGYDWGLRPWRRHSLVLLVAGLSYAAIGVTYVQTEPVKSRAAALTFALDVMPMSGWGYVFLTVGTLAVISSRWPPASETWGYAMLSCLAGLWAGFYLLGVIVGAPNQSASGALLWGLVAFLWWAIAGLVNPDDDLVRVDRGRAPLVPPQKNDGV